MEYVFIGLFAAIIIYVLMKFFLSKGYLGELQVRIFLGRNKKNKKYVINDLMIVHNGKSSQIDHVVITRRAIFIIETKNYAGRIYGYESQREWTQVFNYGRSKHRFYNPIMQNKTHLYALSEVLDKKDWLIPIVVFPKAQLEIDCDSYVGDLLNLKKVMKSYDIDIMSIEEINEIYQKLLAIKKKPEVSKMQHIKSIGKLKSDIDGYICPRCGEPLVRRNGKYGPFFGCRNYPKCKYIKKEKY